MYFKKLEIVGFKSFMEKTVLNFEPGVTAIVGPNGCGKSNIFDSIRWVLGEQSVKSLRGSQMEDVIFNGTDAKAALSMAEVSLTFDNENRVFPLDYKEITITRRIFRSGECEYLINKASARLKDILDLLMGTGIGAESYSLVAQGKIDLVLSSKPEDRRVVFDEAAGITKYKAQKKEAVKKLEETEQNLLRVNDIIAEVRRSIGYLERQANKARRYKEAFGVLQTKELSLALYQKGKLTEQKQEIVDQLEVLKEQESTLQAEIEQLELDKQKNNDQLASYQSAIEEIKTHSLTLENTIARTQQHKKFNEERIAELQAGMQYLTTQIDQVQKRLAQDEENLGRLKEEEQGLKRTALEKEQLLKDKELKLNELIASTRHASEAIHTAQQEILALEGQESHLKNETVDGNSKKQILLSRKKRLDIEKLKAVQERMAIEETLNGLTAELTQIEASLSGAMARLTAAHKDREGEQTSLTQLTDELEQLERQKITLQSHKEFLEKLKVQYESIDTSMNALIYLDVQPQEKISGLVVKFKDNPPLNDAEKALGSAYGYKIVGEAKPIDLDAQRVAERIQQLEERICTLREEKAAKEKHVKELSGTIASLQQDAQDAELLLSNKKAVFQGTSDQCAKIKEEENIVVLELSDVENELSGIESQLVVLTSQCAAIEQEKAQKQEFIHKEQEAINSNASLKEQSIVEITKIKTELQELSRRLGSEDSSLKMLEDTCAHNRQSLSQLAGQMEENKQKQTVLSEEITALDAQLAQAELESQAKQEELIKAETLLEEFESGLSENTRVMGQTVQHLDIVKEKLHALQMREKDFDFKYLSIKERIAQVYKIDLDTYVAPAPVAQEPPPVVPADASVAAPTEASVETTAAAQPMPAAEQPLVVDEEAVAQEIETLKAKIDSYGTVNLVAIEEYEELKKRYDFLTQQQADLTTARESIQEAISKINRTTKKMFIETFEKVAEEFRNYFRLLFNGGDARIFLTNEQEPLESGIEIICRPPGKKLQNVLLLSGGEKTMSAIALIFAIFKVKPAPFCILDEIDAALDEANVDRFGRLLQEFTTLSQFIVITHNKKTIANADVMYGITMIESGVSRIISVKFAQNRAQAAESETPVEKVEETTENQASVVA